MNLTRDGLAAAAAILRAGTDGVALLRTVMAVECRGSGFDKQGRVLILYEPHIAFREAGATTRARLIAEGLAYPKWGEKPYPKDSYPAFERAKAINAEVACKACSWGLGQILGTNHLAAGYLSARAMAEAFAFGEDEQAAAMARFVVANSAMHAALLAHNWSAFAARYNGLGYAKNAYDAKLAAAYAKFQRAPWAGFSEVPAAFAPITQGMRGDRVADLQRRLSSAGLAIAADGDFGPITVKAVRAFQQTKGLPVTGIVDAATWAALT